MLDWISGKILKFDKISPLIISSPFVLTMDGKSFENVIAHLYQQLIILENKKSSLKIVISFQFDVIFELIRFKDENGELGSARSIKFFHNQDWIQLKNSSIPKDMHIWMERLTLKLNQKGFHEYYQAIRRIGKGGFASVYLVKNKYNKEQVAVKAFSKQAIAEESKGLDSLEKQINIMRTLNHPNLMKLYEVYETPNSFYLCVQLLSGGSLSDRIRNKQKLTTLSVKKIMKSILEGLEYMHSKNLMHRDLKPDNILFRTEESDQCVIADFGLGEHSQAKQYLFSRCGTPGYVAPQVANLKNSSQKYTVGCDLFSLGVIFHILALKKPPFEGRQYNDVLIKNRNCRIDFNESQYKKLPETWLDLMKKLLSKDPRNRISAQKALEHQFFEQEVVFKEFVQKRRKESKQKMTLSISQKDGSLTNCDSNILLSGNRDRKNNLNLDADSCLKFKMHENVLTGKVQQSSQNINEIDSPLIVKKGSGSSVKSRFKSRA